ncbi:MAG: GH92 family glycosyl hydrolase [Bacteroidia bacterium]
MQNLRLLITLVTTILLSSFSYAQRFTQYVDPMTGTGGFGHTFPGATVPYGMMQLSPDTRRDNSWEGCGGYYYNDSLIFGFSHTHLSGTGCSDYGDVLVMPVVNASSFNPRDFVSTYDHEAEIARPGYYAVTLTKDHIRAEMTTTVHSGMHAYTMRSGVQPSVLVDLRHRDRTLGSSLQWVSRNRITGYRHSEAWAKDQYIYFVMEFDLPVAGIRTNSGRSLSMGETIENDSVAVFIDFDHKFTPSAKEYTLLIRTAISTVDTEGAVKNLEAEITHWDFKKVQQDADAAWDAELSKLSAYGATAKELTNFYTSLYHAMVVPNVISDVDGRYRGRDNKIHTADGYTQYTVFSLWDTFRAAHPLYTLIDRKRTLDYVRTFLAQYKEGGRLPVWELGANETDCMIGYHSIPVITDALVKGVSNFDTTLALEAMKKSATWNHLGLPAYMRNGYVAVEDESESVSKTLEYAYDDWCISRVAAMLGKPADERNYLQRAASYRNVYDPSTGFMRPRRNGDFIPNFDPREVNNHYTEANSWQYSFFVPQDIPGLVKLMGGAQQAEAKLDGLFSESSKTTGRTQADITGMIGQYAHGNEPSHHMAYLYDYIGKPWKTQRLVRQIMDSLYHKGPEGLPGNEDCGQMSAWFVWSAMGFYPVTPGSPYYAIGSPLFDSLNIHLENGKTVHVKVQRLGLSEVYVKRLLVDGKPLEENLITHDQLTNAREIIFEMSASPVETRGTGPELRTAMSPPFFYRAPVIKSTGRLFSDSLVVEVVSPDGGQILTGMYPNLMMMGEPYRGPFVIHESTTLYAQTMDQKGKSGVTGASFYKIPTDWKVILHTTPSRQYMAEGPVSMIDGIRGTESWRKGDWHGYQSRDMDVEVCMDRIREITEVDAGFLQDTRAWILMPKEMIVEVSVDGSNWTEAGRVSNKVPDSDMNPQVQTLKVTFKGMKAKYVRVKAVNYGKLPAWHLGAGDDAYIFTDEIIIH